MLKSDYKYYSVKQNSKKDFSSHDDPEKTKNEDEH
jgi:hypothetical protein